MVAPVVYAVQSVRIVPAEQEPFPFITTLYVPPLSAENESVEVVNPETVETVAGVIDAIVTTGATGVATVSTRSAFLSSSSNAVFASVESVILPSSSAAAKLVYEKVLSPVAASVVMPAFLKIAVFPSTSQLS